jgi:hypothetical protein
LLASNVGDCLEPLSRHPGNVWRVLEITTADNSWGCDKQHAISPASGLIGKQFALTRCHRLHFQQQAKPPGSCWPWERWYNGRCGFFFLLQFFSATSPDCQSTHFVAFDQTKTNLRDPDRNPHVDQPAATAPKVRRGHAASFGWAISDLPPRQAKGHWPGEVLLPIK